MVLDLEMAVDAHYVNGFNLALRDAGYKTTKYGSRSTIWKNPRTDGGTFVAWPGHPNTLDTTDYASTMSLLINMTAELAAITANSSLLNVPINQRGTFRWRSLETGDNLVVPATAQSGIVVRVLSLSYTGTSQGTVMWIE